MTQPSKILTNAVVPERDIERVRAEERTKSPPRGKAAQIAQSETQIGLRREDTPLKKQVDLNLKSAVLYGQTDEASQKISRLENFIETVKNLAKEKDPAANKKLKEDLTKQIDTLKESINDKPAAKVLESPSYQKDKEVSFGKAPETKTSPSYTPPEKIDTDPAPVETAPPPKKNPVRSNASSAPPKGPLSLPELLHHLRQQFTESPTEENVSVNADSFYQQTETNTEAPSLGLSDQVDQNASVVSIIDKKTIHLISQVASELVRGSSRSSTGESQSPHLTRLLDNTLKDLKEGKKKLENIQAHYRASASSFDDPMMQEGELPPDEREAENIAHKLSTQSPRSLIDKSQYLLAPDAIAQLLA